MKTFFIVALFSLFLFPSCSETPQIISDVCDITQEICYYANLVCQNFNSIDCPEDQKNATLQKLNSLNFEVKNISDQSSNKTLTKNFEYQQETKYRLMQIRDELRDLYLQQKK